VGLERILFKLIVMVEPFGCMENKLFLDPTNATTQSKVEREDVEVEMVVATPESCRDMLPASQQTERNDDDDDSSSRFSMVYCSALPIVSIAIVPYNGVDDHICKGDDGDCGTHHCLGESNDIPSTSSKAEELVVYNLDKELIDYRPSPSDKEQEELEE
jgi:hypothetical protein